MKVEFKKYIPPKQSDTCVAFCFFRPIEYSKPVANLRLFVKDLESSEIPYFFIEMLYDGQAPVMPNPTKIVRSKSVLFSKENLWNILEKHIPESYSKIIFLDCDVRFSNPDWFNICSKTLDRHPVIQPMDYTYRDIHGDHSYYEIDVSDNKMFKPTISKGIVEGDKIRSVIHYPGLGLGVSRSYFRTIGGMYELGLNGPGDSLFWSCFCDLDSRVLDKLKDFGPYVKYKSGVLNAAAGYSQPVSCVMDNIAMHMYHGSIENRKYGNREIYMPEQYDLFHNEDGVLEIKSDRDLIQYWIDRKEDD
jgi:hypothetical protein